MKRVNNMANYSELFIIPELIGKRVNHTSTGYGPGTINNAWLKWDGSDHITISFDHRDEAASSFCLSKCMMSGLIFFEDDCYDEAWLNELIASENTRRLEEMHKGTTQVKTQAPKKCVVGSSKKANGPSESPTLPKLEDLDFFIEEEPIVQLTPEQEKAEKEAVYTFLTQERGVQQLVHFTPEKNLLSILEHGILPRAELEKQNIDAITPDPDRFDFQLNYTSFSISFPNYLIFYNKRNKMTDTPFVILCIDPKIILDLPLRDVSYLPDNAASSSINNVLHFTGIEAAKGLFSDKTTVRGITHSREELTLPKNYPTNPQAEVFLRGTIPIKYITSIHTENSGQNETVRSVLPEIISKKINIYTKSKLYLPRIDHRFWLKTEAEEKEN